MWILFGNKVTTERVPNGARVERHCSACGETAMFYERTVSSKLSLYFVELLEYGKRRVMACGACGELYATDELGAQEPHVAERVLKGAEDAGAEISTAAKAAFGKLSAATKTGLRQLGLGDEEPARVRRDEPLADDPLTSDEQDLEAKFKDLEKKYRIGS